MPNITTLCKEAKRHRATVEIADSDRELCLRVDAPAGHYWSSSPGTHCLDAHGYRGTITRRELVADLLDRMTDGVTPCDDPNAPLVRIIPNP